MKRVLAANRGEIALRVIRGAHDAGIEAVAVFSEADAEAPHVRAADHAVPIGPAPAQKSYLDAEALIEAARVSGADAVHPGYGFLAEQAGFARAVESAGLAFVGPTGDQIELMGDKSRARALASESGVPTIPGSDGPVADSEAAVAAAREVGFPLALKAAGGGGGKGIRVVPGEDELAAAYAAASREAEAAFNDPRLYVERIITPARHIEVQILGDGERAVHLYERDCSLQRRRQKVIEESPAFDLDDGLRLDLCEAAVRLAEAVGYRSAGTVEFLVDPERGEYYFLEMNTRIQVEHPVSEINCGIDLIGEQLAIAAGGKLRIAQDDIVPRGSAIELRLNAEDPAHGFMPSPGPIERVVLPGGPWVRVDSWMESGGEVPPFYDSLLGKLIVWGEDRPAAIRRARRALSELEVVGVKTTRELLASVLEADWFEAGRFNTTTLETWMSSDEGGWANG